MNRLLVTMALCGALIATGCGTTQNNAVKQSSNVHTTTAQTISVSNSGPVVLNGLAKPADANWVKQLKLEKVYDANGKQVLIPTDKPIVFFGWWCKYCHAAIQLINKNHESNDFYYVSVLANGNEPGHTPVTINSEKDVSNFTGEALKKLGVELSADHVFYTMPTDNLNKLITSVPTVAFESKNQWYVMSGVPNDNGILKQIIKASSK